MPKYNKDTFIESLSHPRQVELAEMIFNEASPEEMVEKGYGRINVLEMAKKIAVNVEGFDDFVYDFPKDEAQAEAEVDPEAEGPKPEGHSATPEETATKENAEGGETVAQTQETVEANTNTADVNAPAEPITPGTETPADPATPGTDAPEGGDKELG